MRKSRWELHKNAMSEIEQILEAIPHETAVRPHTSHLKDHPSKTKKTYETLLEKQGWIHKWHSSMDLYTWTCQCWQTVKNYISSVQKQDVIWKIYQKQWRETENQGNLYWQCNLWWWVTWNHIILYKQIGTLGTI